MNALEQKATELNENGSQLVVSLVMDEVAIQRNMMYCRATNRFIGLIDCGKPKEKEDFHLAKNVIVFMAVGVNIEFQQPVAYYFIQTLTASERAVLVKEIIVELTKRGVKVANVTFDGYNSNIKMSNLLGAELYSNVGNYKTYFVNPHDKSKVYVVLDASHMIKLVRNTLGSRGIIWSGSDKEIKWSYIEELVKHSQNNSFGLSHKLNKRHLQWQDRKMHVRTAVETLSDKTSNSIEFLMVNKAPNFANATDTVEFLRIFDQLWDIMNTQRIENGKKKFKSAINPSNAAEVFEFLTKAKKYILSLRAHKSKSDHRIVKIITSTLRTGFRGFIINIESFKAMYYEMIEEKHWLLFFATYRFSQDFLEMLFGKIRAMNGHNDNPNSQQFSSSYRKLLYEADMVLSEGSNVKMLGYSNVLMVSSNSKSTSQVDFEETTFPLNITIEDRESFEFEIEQYLISEQIDNTSEDPGIVHIASELERRLKSSDQIYCKLCPQVLEYNEKVNDDICISLDKCKPCLSTFLLCKHAINIMKIFINKGSGFQSQLYNLVLEKLPHESIFPEFFADQEHSMDHKTFLIKYFIDESVNVKCALIAKQKTISTQKKYLRNRLKKIGHYLHL